MTGFAKVAPATAGQKRAGGADSTSEELTERCPSVAKASTHSSGVKGASGQARSVRLAQGPTGIYVHFPWCLKKCPYCDFLSIEAEVQEIPHEAYANAVIAELVSRLPALGSMDLRSVFFGGGTPSLWSTSSLEKVLAAIKRHFSLGSLDDLEITVECNPSSFDRQKAERLRAAGVNRVSLGVQSLDAEQLRFLGRLHGPDEALKAVRAAIQSGMPHVSADLMHSVFGQTPEAAAGEAQRLIEEGIDHLSAYALTIEPRTEFFARARKGKLPLLDDAVAADCYVAVREALGRAGFLHYEISNFCRAGGEARHNLIYWRGQSYLGLGTGAYGTVRLDQGTLRYRNTPSPERYLCTDFRTVDPWSSAFSQASFEWLDAEVQLSERIMLGLRLAEGLAVEMAARELGADPWPEGRLRAREALLSSQKLVTDGDRLRIPPEQWLFADGIIRELL